MNNKNTIIGISIALIVIAILALIIVFKGNDMWKWIKKKCGCLEGEKEEIDDNDVKPDVKPVTKEEIDELKREFNDFKKNKKEIHEERLRIAAHMDKVIIKHEGVLREMGVGNIEEFVKQNKKNEL